ncbi:unnamed protein product [Caenorhabditis sp. 36 PRJEB53466]|nr:unnamed protein product [Caenorhabditis sp. 36 PRJEB53466]
MMSGLRKDELIAVYIDIDGDKRKMVEDIADTVLRKVLEEEENSTPIESRAPSTTSSTSSPLSISQLLSSSFSQPPANIPAPVALNPFQLALCQTLVANNTLPFSLFGGPSPMFPLFVPPPQPPVESVELLKIFQNILAKQKK